MNKMDFYSENYFSQQTGYVIDGRRFKSRDSAANYLIRNWYVQVTDAVAYLNRLVRAFQSRMALVEGVAA